MCYNSVRASTCLCLIQLRVGSVNGNFHCPDSVPTCECVCVSVTSRNAWFSPWHCWLWLDLAATAFSQPQTLVLLDLCTLVVCVCMRVCVCVCVCVGNELPLMLVIFLYGLSMCEYKLLITPWAARLQIYVSTRFESQSCLSLSLVAITAPNGV